MVLALLQLDALYLHLRYSFLPLSFPSLSPSLPLLQSCPAPLSEGTRCVCSASFSPMPTETRSRLCSSSSPAWPSTPTASSSSTGPRWVWSPWGGQPLFGNHLYCITSCLTVNVVIQHVHYFSFFTPLTLVCVRERETSQLHLSASLVGGQT